MTQKFPKTVKITLKLENSINKAFLISNLILLPSPKKELKPAYHTTHLSIIIIIKKILNQNKFLIITTQIKTPYITQKLL